MKKKFWLVWNPRGRNPTRPHATETDARNEAERLAALPHNNGDSFVVLEAFAVYRRENPPVRVDRLSYEPWSEEELAEWRDDEIPF